MLSLILPPLFVVASLAVLLFIFFRKLPEVERRETELSGINPAPFVSISDRLKRFVFGFVEKFARFSKLFSLKLHNRLNALASWARAARLRAAERITERKRKRSLQKETELSIESEKPMNVEEPHRERRVFSEEKREVESSSELTPMVKRWFKKEQPVVPSSDAVFPEESFQAPLVSEPLEPNVSKKEDQVIKKRADDISRRFGSVVKRFRPEKFSTISREIEPDIPVLSKKGQMEDILVERISLNPRDIEAYERLGDYYLEQKNLVDAKECYRQVLKLSPAYRLVKIKIRRLERLLEKEHMP